MFAASLQRHNRCVQPSKGRVKREHDGPRRVKKDSTRKGLAKTRGGGLAAMTCIQNDENFGTASKELKDIVQEYHGDNSIRGERQVVQTFSADALTNAVFQIDSMLL
ncbi:hypothetical protein Tco_0920916 [Tanacetum coccineum]